MPFAVQLDVDRATQAVLDEVDQRLVALGLTRTMRRLAAAHHLAFGVYQNLPAELDGELGQFAAGIAPVSLRLGSIGVFPGPQAVLFLAPVVTERLLQLHRLFHTTFAQAADQNAAYYQPGAWVPHVTLALDVPPTQLPDAVAIASSDWQPCDVVFDQLRVTEFEPVTTRQVFALAP
jgi:2'-5' RNA ligase